MVTYGKSIEEIREYAYNKHKFVNQKYGDSEYSKHLEMVRKVALRYFDHYFDGDYEKYIILGGCDCHDIIEDCRETFNNVLKNTGNEDIAEIARLVTSDPRGRTREERFPKRICDEIKENRFALYIKLCDRIANTTNSLNEKHRMFNVYKEEYERFKEKLYTEGVYPLLWLELDNLNKNNI